MGVSGGKGKGDNNPFVNGSKAVKPVSSWAKRVGPSGAGRPAPTVIELTDDEPTGDDAEHAIEVR
jgi:hypothetical protein